jgi:hypothetical protein
LLQKKKSNAKNNAKNGAKNNAKRSKALLEEKRAENVEHRANGADIDPDLTEPELDALASAIVEEIKATVPDDTSTDRMCSRCLK